jgi:hypothetical protein
MLCLSIATHQHITHQHGGSEENMQARIGQMQILKKPQCEILLQQENSSIKNRGTCKSKLLTTDKSLQTQDELLWYFKPEM